MINIKKLGAAVSATMLVGLSSTAHAETWRYAIEVSQGDVQDLYAQEFKKRIEEKTNGEVTVQIFYGGTLGTSADTTELLSSGALQFANASVGHLGASVPTIQLLSIPFLLSDNYEVTKTLLTESSAIYEGTEEDFDRNGLELLTLYSEGEDAWATNKEVYSPEDLNNLKIRTLVSPLQVEAMKHMGASPTPLPYGELYGALQMGVIDGVAQPLSSVYRSNFFEVTDSITSVRHQPFLSSIISSDIWLSNLPEDRQNMIRDTVNEVSLYMMDEIPALEKEFLENILKEKPEMTYIKLNEEQRNVFRERSRQTRDEYVELTGDKGKNILTSFLAEKKELEGQATKE